MNDGSLGFGRKSIKTNAVLNVVRQCCGIVFPLIVLSYVTRVLGAENYGRISFVDSIVSYFTLLAALGIPVYAVREGARIRNDSSRLEQFVGEVYTLSLLSLLASVLLFLLFVFGIKIFRAEASLFCVLIINTITNILGRDWVNTIFEDYFYVTIRYIIFHVLALLFVILFVKKPEDVIIYAFSLLIANSCGYILNFFYTQRYVKIRISSIIKAMGHIKPVMILFFTSLAARIYIYADVTILGVIKTNTEVGIYSLASKVYVIAKTLMNAIIMVAIPRLSNYLGTADYSGFRRLIQKLLDVLIVFLFPSIIGMIVLGEDILRILGGEEYISGAAALQILAGALLFSVLACLYANAVLVPLKREKYFMIASIVSAVENVIMNILLIYPLGMEGAAITTLLSEITVLGICVSKAKDIEIKVDLKNVMQVLVACVPVLAVCVICSQVNMQSGVKVGVCTFVSAILYFVFLGMEKNEIFIDLIYFSRNKSK